MRHVLPALAVLLLLVTPASAQDFQKGLEATKRGDYTAALREFRPLAEQGNAIAQFNLGILYGNGQGVPQDYAEAAKWYRLAAEQGLAEAQYNLGVSYDIGPGVPQDYAEAAKWYRLAAEQGLAEAQYNLGVLYDIGRGVPKDYVLAYMWLNLGGASPPFVKYLMTPSDISMAQRMAREWLEAHPQ